MKQILWKPSERQRLRANMTRFIQFVNTKFRLNLTSYDELYNWSISNREDFWEAIWEFGDIKASQNYTRGAENIDKILETKWFVGTRLNFAQNLLRYRDGHTAIVFKGENCRTARRL